MPPALQLLPLYTMSIQKSLALRGGAEVRIDERAFYQHLTHTMDLEESKVFVYPRLFSLHDMPPEAGMPSDEVEDESQVVGPFKIRLPRILNLSHERFNTDGIYLLENGFDIFLWIGRAVPPNTLGSLFGVPTLDGVDLTMLDIKYENGEFASRVSAVIVGLRQNRCRYMQMRIIREGDGQAEAYLARYLVEDR